MLTVSRSPDNRYQYELTYRWADGPVCGFILLNPSTARIVMSGENVQLGATGARCVNHATAWGYSGIVVRNRFAYRVTDPRELRRVEDPYGPENLKYLLRAAHDPITVAAWGNSAIVRRAPALPSWIKLSCIGVNTDGSPRHILHAPATATLEPWPQ